ncbi:hypothetical protein EAO69_33465 [Streptomyces sp. me109]|nr:hypothetical protein EAO69_33465 [Streptomyces sp. me109]
MPIGAGGLRGRRGRSDHRFTDCRERELQRRAEERMPGVPLREWTRRLLGVCAGRRERRPRRVS